MLRNLSRHRQLTVLSVGALAAMVVVGTLQVLEVSDKWRLAGHVLVLICTARAVAYGVQHSGAKPTWFLPRVVFAFFTLGTLTTLIAGDYLRAAIGAVLIVILPLLVVDDRWNTLFRYRTDA